MLLFFLSREYLLINVCADLEGLLTSTDKIGLAAATGFVSARATPHTVPQFPCSCLLKREGGRGRGEIGRDSAQMLVFSAACVPRPVGWKRVEEGGDGVVLI